MKNIQHLIPQIERKIELISYMEILSYSSLQNALKIAKPDYVFHLAAQSYPKTSFDSPIDTLNTNILGTAKLLEAIKNESPESIVHICASSEVFGRVSRDKLPINEECTFHPASPYAISKVGTDLVGRFYGEAYGLKCVTTRMFTHTGPRRRCFCRILIRETNSDDRS